MASFPLQDQQNQGLQLFVQVTKAGELYNCGAALSADSNPPPTTPHHLRALYLLLPSLSEEKSKKKLPALDICPDHVSGCEIFYLEFLSLLSTT